MLNNVMLMTSFFFPMIKFNKLLGLWRFDGASKLIIAGLGALTC